MPDLTQETLARCTSLHGSHPVLGTKGDEYTVTCSGWADWHCTCPAHRFHPDTWCKHIREVRNAGCGWHQLFDPGRPNDGLCPRCGGPVEYFTALV